MFVFLLLYTVTTVTKNKNTNAFAFLDFVTVDDSPLSSVGPTASQGVSNSVFYLFVSEPNRVCEVFYLF